MKKVLLSLITILATQAHGLPEDSLPTLIEIKCKSIFEGAQTLRISSERTHDSDGYTTSMTLSYDKQKFSVHAALVEPSDIAKVLAHSPLGRVLELTIEQDPALLNGEGFGPATLKIDGIDEDYLKFVCRAGFVD